MNSVILLTIIVFLLFMSRGVTGPVNSLYVRSLGASYAVIGVLGTVGSMTSLAFSYLWGHISDRMAQRKRFMMIGLIGIAISLGLTALVPNYLYLFPLRITGAIAQSAYGTTSLALMGDLLERRRGRGKSMGTYRGLASLGFGLMAFVSGSIADHVGLRVPFGLAGGLAALAFFLSFTIQEAASSRREAEAQPAAQSEVAQADPATEEGLNRRLPMMPLLVSAFLWSLVTSAVYAVWANYMVEELGYSRTVMSRLWATASTSEFPLMIVAGWMSDRLGRLPMLSLGFLAWTAVFLGYVLGPMMPWIVMVQLTRGFAYSAYTATAMTYATEVRSKAKRGRASGLFNSAGGLGMILGSTAGGTLAQTLGFVPMILSAAGLIFAGAVYLAVCAVFWGRNHAKVMQREDLRG
ncbi:MAG: MFS transporter [Chloroflexota bacterium]|nr:MFS transporter [Chloroflexota bacterium]